MGVVATGGEIGVEVGVGVRGRCVGGWNEAEARADRHGEAAAEALEREAEEEAKDLVAAETLRITGYVLAEVRRQVRHSHQHPAAQHHLSVTAKVGFRSLAFVLLFAPFVSYRGKRR